MVNNFYERTSTKKTGENLRVLQNQADSTRIILDHSLDQLAQISELQPNPNPLYYTNQVPFVVTVLLIIVPNLVFVL